MPSLVSIGLQNQLHRRQSSLRTSEEIICNRQEIKRGENFPCAFLFGKGDDSLEEIFGAIRQKTFYDFVLCLTSRRVLLAQRLGRLNRGSIRLVFGNAYL